MAVTWFQCLLIGHYLDSVHRVLVQSNNGKNKVVDCNVLEELHMTILVLDQYKHIRELSRVLEIHGSVHSGNFSLLEWGNPHGPKMLAVLGKKS